MPNTPAGHMWVWDVQAGKSRLVTKAEAAAGHQRYGRATFRPGSPAAAEVDKKALALAREAAGRSAPAARAGGETAHPGATEKLHEYWVHGEGAAKIRWGEPDDFARCVEHLGKYIRDPNGYCNLAHKSALGYYPAQHAAMEKGRSMDMTKVRAAAEADGAERRYTPGPIEVRTGGGEPRIGGYGAVFGKLSRNLGGFVELVGEGAFNQSRSLGWPNVVCRYNHDPNMVLGTTAGQTLQLRTDGFGLDYEVDPPKARADILELVQRNDIQFSSFAFRVPSGGDEWSVTDQDYPLRTLHEVQLVDVAPVLDPAYPDASAGLRSLASAKDIAMEEVVSMAAQDELRRLFVRTDNRGPAVRAVPKVTGPAAMMRLMEKRRDPFADQG